MKRLLAIVLIVAACEGGGAYATAAPALGQIPQDEVEIAAFLPAPAGGTGRITFGVAYDHETLAIPSERTRFKRTYREIAWSADLIRPVNTSFVTWLVVSLESSGAELPVFDVEEPTDQPGVTVLANAGDLTLLVGHAAGTYVMRYLDGSELLAEGSFTLVE